MVLLCVVIGHPRALRSPKPPPNYSCKRGRTKGSVWSTNWYASTIIVVDVIVSGQCFHFTNIIIFHFLPSEIHFFVSYMKKPHYVWAPIGEGGGLNTTALTHTVPLKHHLCPTFWTLTLCGEEEAAVWNPADEIKRIYSFYKGKTLTSDLLSHPSRLRCPRSSVYPWYWLRLHQYMHTRTYTHFRR